MYLSDLSFLEEGTPSLGDDGLLNFSKLRMVSYFFVWYSKRSYHYILDYIEQNINYRLYVVFELFLITNIWGKQDL